MGSGTALTREFERFAAEASLAGGVAEYLIHPPGHEELAGTSGGETRKPLPPLRTLVGWVVRVAFEFMIV